ncbi:MAG: DNA polymerase ligase N-terminal domain-containing protein [Candidatus Pacearchaeota archaeon]
MPIFVIQEHNATKKHWDLRLELNNVLKSWAVTKIPPKIKSIKRLAIQVPDHPLDYANFEGEIKEGYGKGTVKLWDRGTYELEDKSDKKFVFNLNGKNLKGRYALIKTSYGKDKNSWLFFKI